MAIGIYRLHNLTKKKAYVGSSTDIKERLQLHLSKLKKGSHPQLEMQADYNAGDFFYAEILYEVDSDFEPCDLQVRLAVAEQMFMDDQSALYNRNEAPIQAALINKYLYLGLIGSEWEVDLENHILKVREETGLRRDGSTPEGRGINERVG